MKDKRDLLWYEIENSDQLDSPALVFYPDRIADNINLLKRSINDVGRLRPHVKTHKSAEVTFLMIKAGITKFKCATIAEAEMLGNCGARDVMLAYQPVGPKIERFIQLMQLFPATKFSCLVDDMEVLNDLLGEVKQYNSKRSQGILQLNVFIDINIGMGRTGILPDEHALSLYEKIGHIEGVNILGLHAYDGHIHESDLEKRKIEWQLGWDTLSSLRDEIIRKGLNVQAVVAGGTPTYPFYAAEPNVECSPGTFILWDKGYQSAFPEQNYALSAILLCRVISITSASRLTLDLGHKAVAAENELTRRVTFLNAPEAKIVSQSEEHLVLEMPTVHGFKIGDLIYGVPLHICPTVSLYHQAAVVRNHQYTEDWPISSRDRKINI